MVKQADSSDWILPAEIQTSRIGEIIGSIVFPGTLVLLSGPTGVGKTSFCKGIAKSLGIREVLTSPTFLTWQSYEGGRMPLFHGDLDRFSGRIPEEFEWALTESSAEKLALVEWGEKVSQRGMNGFNTIMHLSFSWCGDNEDPDRKLSFSWYSASSLTLRTEIENEINLIAK